IMGANAHHSIFEYRRALSQHGIYVLVGGDLVRILQGMVLGPLLSLMGSKKTCFFIADINQKDLGFLKQLLEGGKVVPVIDRRSPSRPFPSTNPPPPDASGSRRAHVGVGLDVAFEMGANPGKEEHVAVRHRAAEERRLFRSLAALPMDLLDVGGGVRRPIDRP